MLHLKLVLLLTDILQSYLSASLSASLSLRDTMSFILPRYWKSRGTSPYTTYIHLNVCKQMTHIKLLLFYRNTNFVPTND